MTDNYPKNLSRRDALKLLGAAAGASVLATVPSKWKTPRVVAGVLPAHAQTSVSASGGNCGADDVYLSPSYDDMGNFEITVFPPGSTVFYWVRLNGNTSCVANVSVFGVPAPSISDADGPYGSVVSDGTTGLAIVPVMFDFPCPGGIIRCDFYAGGVGEGFLCEQAFSGLEGGG